MSFLRCTILRRGSSGIGNILQPWNSGLRNVPLRKLNIDKIPKIDEEEVYKTLWLKKDLLCGPKCDCHGHGKWDIYGEDPNADFGGLQ